MGCIDFRFSRDPLLLISGASEDLRRKDFNLIPGRFRRPTLDFISENKKVGNFFLTFSEGPQNLTFIAFLSHLFYKISGTRVQNGTFGGVLGAFAPINRFPDLLGNPLVIKSSMEPPHCKTEADASLVIPWLGSELFMRRRRI